jgi:hypothetical protein
MPAAPSTVEDVLLLLLLLLLDCPVWQLHASASRHFKAVKAGAAARTADNQLPLPLLLLLLPGCCWGTQKASNTHVCMARGSAR